MSCMWCDTFYEMHVKNKNDEKNHERILQQNNNT